MWLAIMRVTSPASTSLPIPPSWQRGVVGDDVKIGFALSDQFVEQTLRCPDRHKSADHDAGAIGDHPDCFF